MATALILIICHFTFTTVTTTMFRQKNLGRVLNKLQMLFLEIQLLPKLMWNLLKSASLSLFNLNTTHHKKVSGKLNNKSHTFVTTNAYQKMTAKCRLVPCCAFKLYFLLPLFCLNFVIYLSRNITLKYLNNIPGTFLSKCFSKQTFSKSRKCSNFSLLPCVCNVWCIYLVVKKDKNLLPDMYSCPKDEHIQELTMKPASERNKIKQDRS